MIENVIKVLVVDNEERELENISKVLNELKIPAYYSLYSIANPPKVPLKGVRLAFFDINLQAGNPDGKQSANNVAVALKQYIDINNGPYVLIYWSSHVGLITQILDFINERESAEIASPILVKQIDKTVVTSPEKLRDIIYSILSEDIIGLLFDYEAKVTHAAGNTLKTLFDIVSNGRDKWGDSTHFEEDFDLVFSNIANETFGFHNTKERPIEAIREGLNPILINELSNIELSSSWRNKLKGIIEAKQKHEFKRISQKHICNLNSIYHINFNNSLPKLNRGSVVQFNSNDGSMNKFFGSGMNQIRHSFLPFNNEIVKEEKEYIKEHSKFIVLEVSAACDFAQNNHRTHNFILGLLVPAFELSKLRKHSDAIICSPFFSYKKKDFIMFFNSRYTYSCSSNGSEFLGDVLFVLKNELLNKIAAYHASYISRLGLIQF